MTKIYTSLKERVHFNTETIPKDWELKMVNTDNHKINQCAAK